MDDRPDERNFWMSEQFPRSGRDPSLAFDRFAFQVTETLSDSDGRVVGWRGVTVPGAHPVRFRVVPAD